MPESRPHTWTVALDRNGFAYVCLAFLIVALTCGGSSSNPISAGFVRVAAVPLLALAVGRLARRGTGSEAIWPLAMLAAAAAITVTQLIPLPPDVWRGLPGHRTAADTYLAAGLSPPWLPISLTPTETWDALLGLVPPAAMFCATLTLGVRERRWLAASVIVVAGISVALGMLQLASGHDSPLRPYAVTNADSAVGFFANRNHQGVFLAVCLPIAAYLATRWAGRGGARAWFFLAVGLGFASIVAVGVATTGSRAGLVLLGIGLAGAVLVVFRARSRSPGAGWRFAALAVPATFAVFAVGLIILAVNPGLEQAARARSGPELRLELNPQVARAGLDFAPLGSGVGSFAPVYQMYEPTESLGPTFVNHAHDEYVELWLETGLPGMALIAAFLAWWTLATWSVLKAPRDRASALSLAGSWAIGMLLIHSLVDYPLRTPAMAVIFALACAMLAPAPLYAAEDIGHERRSVAADD